MYKEIILDIEDTLAYAAGAALACYIRGIGSIDSYLYQFTTSDWSYDLPASLISDLLNMLDLDEEQERGASR